MSDLITILSHDKTAIIHLNPGMIIAFLAQNLENCNFSIIYFKISPILLPCEETKTILKRY